MFLKSAKGADARQQENRNTPQLFRWPLDTAAVLRVFLKRSRGLLVPRPCPLGLPLSLESLAGAEQNEPQRFPRNLIFAAYFIALGVMVEEIQQDAAIALA